jgi:hypothetical protein
MSVTNIELNGQQFSQSLSVSNGTAVLRTRNVPFDAGFTLRGDATMRWTGTKPTGTAQFYELRIGRVQE